MSSSARGWLYLRVALQIMIIIHSMTLLYHLPFLVRCEPKGPQKKYPCRIFEEIADSFSDQIFCHVYCMTKSSFEHLYAILRPQLYADFFPSGGGTHGHHLPYIINTKLHLSIVLRYFAGGSIYDIMGLHFLTAAVVDGGGR
jgi:hypothetical protein